MPNFGSSDLFEDKSLLSMMHIVGVQGALPSF